MLLRVAYCLWPNEMSILGDANAHTYEYVAHVLWALRSCDRPTRDGRLTTVGLVAFVASAKNSR